MSSMRDIKQRIENVRSVEQIIKAMDMVASTKLVKIRSQLEGVRPIYHELKRVVEEVGSLEGSKDHTFYKEREVKNSLYVVITSDRGLAGSYNANITAKALEHMNQDKNVKVITVGAKGYEFFKKKGKNIVQSVVDVVDSQVYYGSESLAKWLINYYIQGEADEMFIAYTHFINVLNYVPVVDKLLPIKVKETSFDDDRKYEPDLHSFIDHMIPLYLHMNLFRAFSESHTSEQAARMVNMDAAGKNASEIIEELTHLYNRKRQTAITEELNEIFGSVNILNKGGLDGS
ncbi:MAG: ATP synthase F1 subunit gamma [Tissierellia bacterium]|jgi:F-type H+-transporting ATPase subunit gamma|nr:ATP synthase F1 subunit gamma [Tissierellia bacterium]